MQTVEQEQTYQEQPLEVILAQLGVSAATYYRWKARAPEGRLADERVVPRRRVLPPTPTEIREVCDCARAHPTIGYKRLAWWLKGAYSSAP